VYGVDRPAVLDLRATLKLTQSIRQFKGPHIPSVNAQCTRMPVKDLKGPVNWSSYCPCYESHRDSRVRRGRL